MSTCHKYPVALQLYSVRDEVNKIGYAEVFKKVAEFGYGAVEFAGLYGQKPGEIRRTLDKFGLKATSGHGAVPNKDNIAQIVEETKELGYEWHIVSIEPELLMNEDTCKRKAEILQAGADALSKENIKLAIHNHWAEFDKLINGKYPVQLVMENAPDFYLQIDTYWAAVAGINVADEIRKNHKLAPMPHIKDGPINQKDPHVAVGEGKMDWKPIMSAFNDKNIKWLVVELDKCATDMFVAVKKSVSYLVANGYGSSRS